MHTLGELSTVPVEMPFSEKAASCQVAYPFYLFGFFFVMKVYTYPFFLTQGNLVTLKF